MFSSAGGEDTTTNYNKATIISLNRVSSVSSKSSSSTSTSSSSSPSSFSPSSSSSPSHINHNQTLRPKTMEEVWKDINLASLHDHSSREGLSLNQNAQNPHFILQDFLARPSTRDLSTSRVTTNRDTALYGSPVPPSATVLSLNSGAVFDFLDNSDPMRSNSRFQTRSISNLPTFNCPLEALASSTSLASINRKKVQECDRGSCDRRHKRMIKNRESAARSRARKQAYTNELENEVKHLMAENARLKRQQEQLSLVASAHLSKNRTLQRTSTAPF